MTNDDEIDFGPDPVITPRPSTPFKKPTKRGNSAVDGYIDFVAKMRRGEISDDVLMLKSTKTPRAHYEPDGAYDYDANLADTRIGAADNAAEEAAERAEQSTDASLRTFVDPITEKQRSYLSSLISQAEMSVAAIYGSLDLDALSKWEASRLIDELAKRVVATPRPVAPAPAAPIAPAPLPMIGKGYYAITTADGTKFYYVSERGFLSIQASDDFHRIHNFQTRREILEAIALDVRGAQELYGQLIGKCGVCGRTLTDEESRALGIGPVCREKGIA